MSEEHPTSPDGEIYHQAWPDSTAWISHGLPFPEACVKHIKFTFNASKAYIIASGSLSRDTKHVKRLQDALGERLVGTRYGMKPHTLWSEVLQVAEEARKLEADVLITLGAGSLTDGAKIVALSISNNATTFSALSTLHDAATNTANNGANVTPPTIPIISIPTSLSGGEYNNRGGASHDDTHRKYSFAGPSKGPRLVILDPELTTTTPERWWISTGVRAVDHCVEAVCSLDDRATPESDADACKGLRMLVPGLLRCKASANDVEARFACQMGVLEAMKAVNLHSVPMGGSHAIGHQLGPLGVGHGETSCILLPAVCTYNQPANAERQAIVKETLWSETEVRKLLEAANMNSSSDLGDMLDTIFRALGMPRTLKEFDIGEDKLNALAENSLHDRWIGTNPRPLRTKDEVLEVLRMVLG